MHPLTASLSISGKNMIRILDDILLVAKGETSLDLREEPVDVIEFLSHTIADMKNMAYMEGVSVRVRKEDVTQPKLISDFTRIRQVRNGRELVRPMSFISSTTSSLLAAGDTQYDIKRHQILR